MKFCGILLAVCGLTGLIYLCSRDLETIIRGFCYVVAVGCWVSGVKILLDEEE